MQIRDRRMVGRLAVSDCRISDFTEGPSRARSEVRQCDARASDSPAFVVRMAALQAPASQICRGSTPRAVFMA
jgi:hypothetical protein